MSDSSSDTAKSVSSSLLEAISTAIKPADKSTALTKKDDHPSKHGGAAGWASQHKGLLIGGGVAVVGLGLLLLFLRKRK